MPKTYSVILSDAEDKALGIVAVSQQEWIDNAVHERCRVAIDKIVQEEIEKKLQSGQTISGSKEDIVLAAQITPLAEQQNNIS